MDDNFDLDLSDLSFDEEGSQTSFDFNEALTEGISNELNLDELSFSDEDESLALDISDDSDFYFDFDQTDDSSDDLGSAAAVLRSRADISVDLLPYYQYTLNARQKLMSLMKTDKVKRIMPPITEFNFIQEPLRQRVYGFFCQTVDDLTTDPAYEAFTEEQAFRYLCKELSDGLNWTPNIYISTFRKIFMSCYSSNKKLSTVTESSADNSLAGLVDINQLLLSEKVFQVNSLPFHTITKFFNNPAVVSAKLTMKTAELGVFSKDLATRLGRRNLTHTEIFAGIPEFLTSDETLEMMKLSRDDISTISTGELFRRFILEELNDGTFYPKGFDKLKSETFSPELLKQLVSVLVVGMQHQSIAAELLYLTTNLMLNAGVGLVTDSERRKLTEEYFQSFVVSICHYLSVFSNDKALINPTFYTLVESVEDSGTDQPIFNVAYTFEDDVCSARINGILCDVIGDTNNIYYIPLVYVGPKSTNVLCPPKEVVDGLRRVATAGKSNISGNAYYRYTPSYEWLSSLNLTSTGRVESNLVGSSTTHISNPLLEMLMHYSNKFDSTGEKAQVVSVHSDSVARLLGVSRGKDEGIPILALQLPESSKILTGGYFVFNDEDNSLLVNYKEPSGEDAVLLLNSDEYDLDKDDISTATSHNEMWDILTSGFFETEDVQGAVKNAAFLRSTVRRLCKLNAFDYEAELEEVRKTIINDLQYILPSEKFDKMIGYGILQLYLDQLKENEGNLSFFNTNTLKEIFQFIDGDVETLKKIADSDSKELIPLLERMLSTRAQVNDECFKAFQDINLVKLSLQGINKGGVLEFGDKDRYMAMHYLPRYHIYLRFLEDCMILLKILVEIDSDITSIFLKHSRVSSAYQDLNTLDKIESRERALKTAYKLNDVPQFYLTREALKTKVSDQSILLKYFALNHNMYGLLSGIEEELGTENGDQWLALYRALKEDLEIADIDKVFEISEGEFNNRVSQQTIQKAFYQEREAVQQLIYSGLVSGACKVYDFRVLKAFDLLLLLGKYLFSFKEQDAEDFTNTKEFEDDFLTYFGSMLVTYSPIDGEACEEIDGGFDRVTAFLKHRNDFAAEPVLSDLDKITLSDLHIVDNETDVITAY